jgi:hypothetical protein
MNEINSKMGSSGRFSSANIQQLVENKNCKSTCYKDNHAFKLLNEFMRSPHCDKKYESLNDLCNSDLESVLYLFTKEGWKHFIAQSIIIGMILMVKVM